MSTPVKHIYQTYIRTTPDKLWDAITDPDVTPNFFMNGRYESTWQPGAPLILRDADDGEIMLDCTVIEAIRPLRIVQTFGTPRRESQRPSQATWEIERRGETCLLTITHEFHDASDTNIEGTQRGWPILLSGLKTLLETGKPLGIPMGEPATAAAS